MGTVQLMTSMVLIGLFTFAIISYSMYFASDNNAQINIGNDTTLTTIRSDIAGNLSNVRQDADSSVVSLVKATISSGDETLESGGQFKVGPFSALRLGTNAIKTGYISIFGGKEESAGFGFFISTFVGLLLIITGFYIWKLWRGNPD